MAATKITSHIHSVGILNPNMRVFDIVMKTESGTSYNSYLVQGEEKTALIETCHGEFFDQYLQNIRQVCDPKQVDYIILNHNEPDHSGALDRLLEEMPNAQVITSAAGAVYLKNITNRPDLAIVKAKDGDRIDLGGRSLEFLSAPFLHWPDSMFTWCPEEGVLFSCDFLGCHYCEPYTFDTAIAYPKAYDTALELYYEAIFGPFGCYVRKGLEKVRGLRGLRTVCTSHGPVLTSGGRLEEVLAKYELWSQPAPASQPLQIPVFYCSAYGNTRRLAQHLAKGIQEGQPTAQVELLDLIEHPMEELHRKLNRASAFAIGTPTLNRDALPPVWNLLAGMDAVNSANKPAVLFGSYGWSGEGVPNVKARLDGLRVKVFGSGMKVCFVPTEEDLERAEKLGRAFAQSLDEE